jgi:hypothetical protein
MIRSHLFLTKELIKHLKRRKIVVAVDVAFINIFTDI